MAPDDTQLNGKRLDEIAVHEGQRRINIIWEVTQALIALVVVGANMIVGVSFGLGNHTVEYPPVLSSALFLVIGFYFSRTNHTRVGGVGKDDIGR